MKNNYTDLNDYWQPETFWQAIGRKLCALGLAAFICGLVVGCKPACDSVAECQVQEAQDKVCRKPQTISEIDGVKLYRTQDGCYGEYIYFSASGTKRTNCRILSKSVRCDDIYVPNATNKRTTE